MKFDSGWRIEPDASGLPRLDDRSYQAWLRNDDDVLVPIGSFNEGEDVTLCGPGCPRGLPDDHRHARARTAIRDRQASVSSPAPSSRIEPSGLRNRGIGRRRTRRHHPHARGDPYRAFKARIPRTTALDSHRCRRRPLRRRPQPSRRSAPDLCKPARRSRPAAAEATSSSALTTTTQPTPPSSRTSSKQHLDNTDLLTGSGGDLLIGRTGDDVLLGENGDDILIGGLEGGTELIPNSDVITGGRGDDINIWAPGDGSDLFDGGNGDDVMVLADRERGP